MITLPWPPKELSPNARIHWADKSTKTKAYRWTAFYATKVAKEKIEHDGQIDLHITFHPPDKRKRDLDGCLSSIKAGLDGIADALGVDDSRFRLRIEMGWVIGGGEVRIILT